MAKYKMICDGDILGYDLIEKRLTSKPSIKGLALSSSSIENFEKLKGQPGYDTDDVLIDRSLDKDDPLR